MGYARRVGRLGVDRDDLLWGLLTWTVNNAWGGSAGTLEDVMPYHDAEEGDDLSPEELERKLAAMIPRRGGRRKRCRRWVDPPADQVITIDLDK